MDWSPSLYLKFENQRNQPITDLIARIADLRPQKAVDLGCGPGNSTIRLRRAFPEADILGVDNSTAMIERAKEQYPICRFQQMDIRALSGQYELIFSNACLQWVPDHETLLPFLISHLEPGGIFAAQFPKNEAEPLFLIIRETAEEWNLTAQAEHNGTLSPREYFDILSACAGEFNIWETKYYHNLPDHNAMLEWVRGSRIRSYLAQLDENAGKDFEAEILRKAQQVYTKTRSGEVLLCFNRFFITAMP